jgi:BFD-like [2Fe-2S] binding domain
MFVCICNAITNLEIIQSIDKYKNENFKTVNSVNVVSQSSEEILEFIKDDIGFDFQCGKCVEQFYQLIEEHKS